MLLLHSGHGSGKPEYVNCASRLKEQFKSGEDVGEMNFTHLMHSLRKHHDPRTPVVLVPNQWNGSVQQYYHFVLGYLAPILRWCLDHPGQPIAVRDCGPMNRWFEILPEESGPEIMTVGDVLHVMAGKLQPHRVLRGMDFPHEFRADEIRTFARYTLEVARQRHATDADFASIIVTDRASSEEFFSTPGAEWPESGSQKRSVPNLVEVVDSLSRKDIRMLDAARVDIYEQILIHSRARILVGQHGAGLTNMLWMPPGSWVIEILPPMPSDATNIFSMLGATLGLHHLTVHQESVHAPIDPDELRNAIEHAAHSITR